MKMLINGSLLDKEDKLDVKNPYDNSIIDTTPRGNIKDVKYAIQSAYRAKKVMASLSSRKISQLLYDIHQELTGKLEEFAKLMTLETGKPIKDSRIEMERSTDTLLLSAEESKRIYGETVPLDAGIAGENTIGFTLRVPVGVVSAITPFNYPVNSALHKIAPAIAAKNTVVIKPSSKAPLSSLKLAELMDSHLPDGVVNCLTGRGDVVGDEMVKSNQVDKVSFTGSVVTGLSISKKASMKNLTLELGGNDPLIVLEDAYMDDAVKAAIKGSYSVAGQVCIAVKRIILDNSVADDFIEKLVKSTSKLRIGDPLDDKTDIGPLIDANAALNVEKLVNDALKNGAELLFGGKRDGAFYTPTVIDQVNPKMQVVKDETFGPVAPIIRVDGIDEALNVANDTRYGLQAGVFTGSIKNAKKAIETIQAGTVLINKSTFRTDNMPFGGFKMSGIGKEGVKYAVENMTRVKLVIL